MIQKSPHDWVQLTKKSPMATEASVFAVHLQEIEAWHPLQSTDWHVQSSMKTYQPGLGNLQPPKTTSSYIVFDVWRPFVGIYHYLPSPFIIYQSFQNLPGAHGKSMMRARSGRNTRHQSCPPVVSAMSMAVGHGSNIFQNGVPIDKQTKLFASSPSFS